MDNSCIFAVCESTFTSVMDELLYTVNQCEDQLQSTWNKRSFALLDTLF